MSPKQQVAAVTLSKNGCFVQHYDLLLFVMSIMNNLLGISRFKCYVEEVGERCGGCFYYPGIF